MPTNGSAFELSVPLPLGISYKEDEGVYRITKLKLAGNAAATGRIRPGLEIVSINGTLAAGLERDVVKALIISRSPHCVMGLRAVRATRSETSLQPARPSPRTPTPKSSARPVRTSTPDSARPIRTTPRASTPKSSTRPARARTTPPASPAPPARTSFTPANPNVQPIEWLPNEIMNIIFSNLNAKTLMVSIPQVCKRWRALCQDVENVHLDFSWWGEIDGLGFLKDKRIPAKALSGWRKTPFLSGSAGGGSRSSMKAARCWKSGLCELFPRTTSVTMGGEYVEDAHLIALAADKFCTGITRACFGGGRNLTDAGVFALAHKSTACGGLTHVYFNECSNLTDAAARIVRCAGQAILRGCLLMLQSL